MPTIRLDDADPAVLDGRHIRASAFEAAQRELIDTLRPTSTVVEQPRPRALTIGAGYAPLPRLLAHAGYQVTALDPSPKATDAARRQAADEVAEDVAVIDYRVREHTRLVEPDDTYKLVWCLDTLEVAPDPGGTLAEIARVTRPGGSIVLDTLNNTLVSRAIYLGLFQRVPFTRVMPRDHMAPSRTVTPDPGATAALVAALHQRGVPFLVGGTGPPTRSSGRKLSSRAAGPPRAASP